MAEKAKENNDKQELVPESKPREDARRDAAIRGGVQQNHWKSMDRAHWLEQDESATGLFYRKGESSSSAQKFGIDGLDPVPKTNADGTPYQVFTQPALMSSNKIDPISPELSQGEYQSSVKLNVQISQIPEVPQPLGVQDALDYASTVMASGAESVHKAEHHLAEANAINNDITATLEYFSHDSNQFNNDVQTAVAGLVSQIDKPLKPEQRARMAGEMLPLFFFEGGKEPIDSHVVKQMNLQNMTEEELSVLNIRRKVEPTDKDIVNPIDPQASQQEKIKQLQALSMENRPLVDELLSQIDTQFGTSSELSFKAPEDIAAKVNRPSIKGSREWFDVEHIRDALRFRTPVDNLKELPKIVEVLDASKFEILKLDLEKMMSPKGRGWRMVAVDLRAPNGQIVEYQILPREFLEAGKAEHQIYKSTRGMDVTKLTAEEAAAKVDGDKRAIELYREAYLKYLSRTGQTEDTVKEILRETERVLKGR